MARAALALFLSLAAASLGACRDGALAPEDPSVKAKDGPSADAGVATFGGGCFWCTEAVFLRLEGVTSVRSGYAGGHVKDPTYEEVCEGTTGHAEVIQVRYDPAKVSYADLLEVFFRTHDPTTKDRQGNDEGPQYRSIVLWHDESQRRTAEDVKAALDASGAFAAPIVTEVVPFEAFYAAEAHHQDYFARNPRNPYCQAVVRPKVEKFEKAFRDRLQPPPAGR